MHKRQIKHLQRSCSFPPWAPVAGCSEAPGSSAALHKQHVSVNPPSGSTYTIKYQNKTPWKAEHKISDTLWLAPKLHLGGELQLSGPNKSRERKFLPRAASRRHLAATQREVTAGSNSCWRIMTSRRMRKLERMMMMMSRLMSEEWKKLWRGAFSPELLPG